MSQEPSEAVEAVVDEQSFIEFIRVLAADRVDEVEKGRDTPSSPYGRGANGWDNGTIEAFLAAASRWADQSINGMPLLVKSRNPWRRRADILFAGKFYE